MFGHDSPRTNQGPLRRTLEKVTKGCQRTVSSMNATNGPLVNRWGIDAFADGNLEKIFEVSFYIVSELIDGCAARKGVSWVSGLFLLHIFN